MFPHIWWIRAILTSDCRQVVVMFSLSDACAYFYAVSVLFLPEKVCPPSVCHHLERILQTHGAEPLRPAALPVAKETGTESILTPPHCDIHFHHKKS